MTQGGGGGPILFERIDANGARGHVNVGMINFGEKEATRWGGWKVAGKGQFQDKESSFVRGSGGTFHFAQDLFETGVDVGNGRRSGCCCCFVVVVGVIILSVIIDNQSNSLRRFQVQIAKLASDACQSSRRQVFRSGRLTAVLTIQRSSAARWAAAGCGAHGK